MSAFTLPTDRPALMGILNVTPDSFSDGGHYLAPQHAIAAGRRMIEEGADLIDIGGESTRPGAEPVSADEEIARTAPVIEALAADGIPISIDTMKAGVAKRGLEAGAFLINDVGGMRDPAMVEVAVGSGCNVCIMHMQGEPRTMQTAPSYGDVVREVRSFLVMQAVMLEEVGVDPERIWLDPGIGFGKTLGHNLSLLRHLGQLVATGYPVLVGVSRKSFLGKLTGNAPADDRLEGTLAAQVLAQSLGARVIRAHDVKATRRAIDVGTAILTGACAEA
jgi:dihydropteroate synthase